MTNEQIQFPSPCGDKLQFMFFGYSAYQAGWFPSPCGV